MYTISTAAAAVTGARHVRVGRNGQDAAAAVVAGDGCGAVVVCDGCSSGAYSEVGARLGAQLAVRLIRDALSMPGNRESRDARPRDIWPEVRVRMVAELARITDAMPGTRERVVHDHFLFTFVAAAWKDDEVAVWAVGDGGYALGDRVIELGPFANNQPPYLGYDLLGAPQPSHLEVADTGCGSVAVMTDGVVEVLGARGLAGIVDDRCFAHPDGLRRKLAVLAKSGERIDWEDRRIVRTPAALQDDGALAIAKWRLPS
jgi:hypothetical protein